MARSGEISGRRAPAPLGDGAEAPRAEVSEESARRYYEALSPFWHPVIASGGLIDGPVPARLLGRELVLARLDGEAVAFEDLCRHLGAALSLGEIVESDGKSCLRCPYHGWSYDGGGRCVDIPARRDRSIPSEAKVRRYATREAYGLVWVCLEDPKHEVPAFPEHDDDRFYVMDEILTYGPWRAGAPRVIMAALDDTHLPWVHPGILGSRDHPEAPDHRDWWEGEYLVTSYEMMQPANSSTSAKNDSTSLDRTVYTNYVTPTSIRLFKANDIGDYVVFQAVCPVSFDETILYLRLGRTFDTDPGSDPEYRSLQDVILEQDQRIVESQRPWLLPPLDSRMLLYVRPADLPLIDYQRWIERLGIPQI